MSPARTPDFDPLSPVKQCLPGLAEVSPGQSHWTLAGALHRVPFMLTALGLIPSERSSCARQPPWEVRHDEKGAIGGCQPADSHRFLGGIHARHRPCLESVPAPGPPWTTRRACSLWRHIKLGHCHGPLLWDSGSGPVGYSIVDRLVCNLAPSYFLADLVTGVGS
jgi:hypothetical protein